MVGIKKKRIGNADYYYLEHSFRENGRVRTVEKYLGKEIPKNVELLKKEFIFGVYKKNWFDRFDRIKANFFKEQKKTPASAKAKEMESFMVKFTYNTNRIEGSTLTLRETSRLLEEGIAPNRPIRDIRETEAHKKVFYEMIEYRKDLSLDIVLYWHKMLFENSKPDIAGKIREHGVAISGSKFVPPSPAELNVELREFFKWYSKNKDKLHPIELAALSHLKFVTIHPFSDGNGRISRLIMNFILHKNGYPMVVIPYEGRNSYYGNLERAHMKKEDLPFVNWFFKWYLKEYKIFL
jgi:Fic family protein